MKESQPSPQQESLIRNISDTARWVAAYRARESERPDAVFHDPFARKLAGERGEQIVRSMPLGSDNGWPMVTRTYVIDEMVMDQVAQGVDTVMNLAAGLDTRPYRLKLPPSLRWVEVDLPEILTYKEDILRGETPVCSLERIRLDLSDVDARCELFAQLGEKSRKALILTEGLLIYLPPEEVGKLAQDLAVPRSFNRWVLDLASPGLLRMLEKRMTANLKETAPFRFAPEEGPEFFARFGWKVADVRSLLKTAARLKRLAFFLRLIARLPETESSRRSRPWSGICLFHRQDAQ